MPPRREKMIRISLPVARFQEVANKVHTVPAERESFVRDPAAYLAANGISIPAELVERSTVSRLLTERHDPGKVAIAV